MFDLQALCDTMGAPTPMCSSPGADAGAASSTIFVINEVLNASGGRTGCFLYRGTLASAAPRSRTPDACCPPPRSSSPSAAGAGGALLGAGGESPSADLAAYEGQEMTLYMSYEEASPKMRQRVAGRAGGYGGGALGAPWRVALRDANDDLVYCARGLPLQAHLDEELRLACWGPSVTLAFPSSEDARTWAAGLSRVGVQACSLADSCAAMALVAHAAQQALAGAGPHKSRVATPAQSCPPSPSRTEQPLAGSKRKAEAAGLATPMMRPRGFATITPNCSCGDLADLLLP